MIVLQMKKHWKLLAGFMLFSVANAVLSLFLITLVQQEVALSDDIAGFNARLSEFLMVCGVLMVCGFCAQHSVSLFSTEFVKRLRMALSAQLLAMPFRQMEALTPHKVLATLSTDVSNLSRAMLIFPALMSNITLVLLCFGYLAWLSFQSFLVLFLTIVGGLVITNLLMSRAAGFLNGVRQKEDRLYKHYRGLTEGAKELNLAPRSKGFFLEHEINPVIADIRETEVKGQLRFNIANNWSNILVFLALGAVVFGGRFFGQLTMDVLVAFVLTTIYLIGPLGMMINNAEGVFRGVVSYKKILSLGVDLTGTSSGTRSGTAATGNGQSLPPKQADWQQLSLNKGRFQYQVQASSDSNDSNDNAAHSAPVTKTNETSEAGFAIGPLDFTLTKGEIVFVVGGNGSGKSTFAKLFTGLYAPVTGHWQVQNTAGSWHNRAPLTPEKANNNTSKSAETALRVAAIYADFFLFDWIVDAAGQPANAAKVETWLARLGLSNKVRYRDGQLSTTALSSGQRKRLALVQAMMLDPDVFLFDEWAADQDSHFRRFFYRELLPELKAAGKTALVISHDDQFFDAADRLVKFDQGQIQLQLNREQLLSPGAVAQALPLSLAEPNAESNAEPNAAMSV